MRLHVKMLGIFHPYDVLEPAIAKDHSLAIAGSGARKRREHDNPVTVG